MPESTTNITDAEREHRLKTWPEFWEAMNSKGKTFEIRKDDRGYEVGDMLVLDEWDPNTLKFTGRRQFRSVRYILRGGQFGLMPGYVCMGLA